MNIVGVIFDEDNRTPVLWPNSTAPPQTLNSDGNPIGFAYGINSLGQIVGQINYGNIETPVFWSNSTALPQKLNVGDGGGGKYNAAYGINSLGQIVGVLNYGDDIFKPVIWTNSTALPQKLSLGDGGKGGFALGINSLGQIVGFIFYGGLPTPVFWPNFTAPPQTLSSGEGGAGAFSINNLGQIVGAIGPEEITSTPVFWASSTALSQPLTRGENVAAVARGINSLGQIVGVGVSGQINVKKKPLFWANSTVLPQELSGGFGNAFGIADMPMPMPIMPIISNICFPAGTPITTDQGRIPIELIDTQLHTIHHQPILLVTRTVTLDKYLISLAPHALGRNVPHTKTLMSKDHKIAFAGQLVPAYRFLDYSDQVKKVTYKGETLYNILLPGYSTMLINNLECETLHPDNIIAKLYTTTYTDAERVALVQEWNASLTQRDNSAYQAVVNRLTTHS